MRLQSLFSIMFVCAQVVTMCHGEKVVQKLGVVAHKAAVADDGYDNWVKGSEGLFGEQAPKVPLVADSYDNWVNSSEGLFGKEAQGAEHGEGVASGPLILPEKDKLYHESLYYSIAQEAAERRWEFPLTFDYAFQSHAFDACGNKTSLSTSLFGAATTLADIFLLSRLSAQGKLHLQIPPPAPNPSFGNSKEQQYLNLLAPMTIGFAARQNNATFGLGALYRWQPWSDTRIACIFGLELPITIQKNSLELNLQDGTLFNAGYISNATNRENTLTQFFKDWTGVEDFFVRGVLGSKGIKFKPSQHTTGIGDLSISANIEFGPFYTETECGGCRGVDFGQVGISIACPTAKTSCSADLWAPEFGNGGGYQFTLFGTCNTRTGFSLINPMFMFGYELHTSVCRSGASGLRIPRMVTQLAEGRVIDNPEIFAPCFREYRTNPFTEIDTTVAMFADTKTDATLKVGRRVFFGFGNYFYDIFSSNMRLSLLYNYSSKKADTVTVKDNSFDASLLQFPSRAHRLSWKLSYKFENLIELGCGSQHIIAGRSVPQQNDVFLSIVASF